MTYRYLLLTLALLMCANFVFADDAVPAFFPKYIPIECRDHVNYDFSDCDSATRLQFRAEEQDKLPDNQRRSYTTLGESILIEKASGLRASLYKILVIGEKTPSTGFMIGTQKSAEMFQIGGFEGCNRGSAIKILKNTPEFTFFYWQCDDIRPNRGETEHFNYFNYDKRYGRLDLIFTSPNYNKTQPTLKLVKGTYKAEWKNYVENGHKPKRLYYDFKIKGNRPEDLECSRTWNEECDLSLQDAPLPPNRYKILDK